MMQAWFELQVLEMGEQWLGGYMTSVDGGQKVIFLLKALEKYEKDENLAIMFVDR